MSAFDTYALRFENKGTTKRESYRRREVRKLQTRMKDNLSYQDVIIYDPERTYNLDRYTDEVDDIDGVYKRNVAIINSDSLNKKYMVAIPGERFKIGSLVFWKDNYWLVTERDTNDTVQDRVKLLQCNYLLKWIAKDGEIIEQWCTVLDAATTNGEYEDRKFIVTKGDIVISLTIGRNSKVDKFERENRFIIDDSDADHKMAFSLTRPFKGGYTYNGEGIFKFILHEDVTNDEDNQELGIADYYRYFPRKDTDKTIPPAYNAMTSAGAEKPTDIYDVDEDEPPQESSPRKKWL